MGLLNIIFKKKKEVGLTTDHAEQEEGLVDEKTAAAVIHSPKKEKKKKVKKVNNVDTNNNTTGATGTTSTNNSGSGSSGISSNGNDINNDTPMNTSTSNPSKSHRHKKGNNSDEGGEGGGGKEGGKDHKPQEGGEEEPVPTIIFISNAKGLQKNDRKWIGQINIPDDVIAANFPTIVHILNFLRKKDSIYYKFIEQPEQVAQLRDAMKDQIPSVIVSSTSNPNTITSGGGGGSDTNSPTYGSSSANSSDEDLDSKSNNNNNQIDQPSSSSSPSKSNKHHHKHHHKNPNRKNRSNSNSTTNNNNNNNGSTGGIVDSFGSIPLSSTPTNNLLLPTVQGVIISNTTHSGGPSISYVYTERKRRIDSARIFIEPGVYVKFPEELEEATHRLLVEGNPKEQFKNLDFEARGGFGSVFAAKNRNPHSSAERAMVALKKMPHSTLKQKRMNLAEIGFMRFCKHPNIVQFLSSYQKNDEVWMIMEFMEGGTLREAIANFNFSETRIAYVAREILKAIQYLHSNNICHRDLKSSNIMISMKGEIKVIDFGLAIDFSIERDDVHMCGSPFWMPPEQIHGTSHSLPADIWSFGVCVAEMLKRKVPHHNSRLKAMIVVATEGMVFPKETYPTWSDEAHDFLTCCLQPDPTKRQSATQLLQHPFISKACTLKEIKEILPALFMSNTLSKQGLF